MMRKCNCKRREAGVGDPRHVKRYLDPILTKAGLPHFRVHDLRHFCASLLLAQGVPLKVVSDILGRTQISITADLYTHVLPAVRKEAIDLMDRILATQNLNPFVPFFFEL